ncbi:DUF1648 domain-containing protein [uncultured Polaribacter sp.]|uniref:DUF1648 domain-containing protein n=1 Tax=uncultured Polaribacter sp. TaxID=174711 RepID=UPI002614F7A6|nr:DUF1648 domain-containing protein [uncultured Polaribacter sp.]
MSKANKNILLFSAVITIASWLYVIFNYNALPEKIVGHFNFNGKATRYDAKYTIWFLQGIFTLLQYGMYWLAQQKLPYNRNLKSKTAEKTIALFTIPYVALVLLFLNILIVKKSIDSSFNSSWFMPFFIGLTILFFVSFFTFIYKNLKT